MKLVDIEVVVHHSTDLAYLVSTDGDRKNAKWIPKSACELEERRVPYKPSMMILTTTQQVAIDKELV